MILVCNTGPLIALAKIDCVPLLQGLKFQRVCIPPRVHKELWGKIGPESAAIEAGLDSFIQVVKPGSISHQVETITADLDQGEKEVISLGASVSGEVILLLDDQLGRKAAKALNLPVVGTVGILLSAKKRGLIEVVTPLLGELRERGYWLSDRLVAHVRELAGEQTE